MRLVELSKLFILLSCTIICSSYILIDPAVIVDASVKLSSFVLGAEVTNVKDVADSIFSAENFAVLTTVATDSLNAIKSSKLGTVAESFLTANPDLKLSTSEFFILFL